VHTERPRISLIAAPYHLGREQVGVGAGPRRLIERGLVAELEGEGFEVTVAKARRETPFDNELQAMTDVNAVIATLVQDALTAGSFPIVLGGNCASSLAPLARLDSANIGVIWFDTHGDFNTPDTSPSGFLDGMTLAVATGRCLPEMWDRAGGSATVRDQHILMAGIRDVDSGERAIFDSGAVQVAWAEHFDNPERGFDAKLRKLREHVTDVYVHVDIDAVDPSEMPGTDFRTSGGISSARLQRAIDQVGANFRVLGATVASFSPAADEDDRSVRNIFQIVDHIARCAPQHSR
jgi:arginase